jgi:hypothetical protein
MRKRLTFVAIEIIVVVLIASISHFKLLSFVNGSLANNESMNDCQLRDPFQQKIFCYDNRAFIYFNNGTQYLLTSTYDTTTYTNPILISDIGIAGYYGASCYGETGALVFDSERAYVHFVWHDIEGSNLCYRRGKINIDGTITLNESKIVHNGIREAHFIMPNIAVDSNGFAWIGACFIEQTQSRGLILKNTVNDGSWVTDVRFPHSCLFIQKSIKMMSIRITFAKMTSGKIAALTQTVNDYIYCDIWNGNSWTVTNETATLQKSRHGDWMSAYSLSDEIYLTYLADNKVWFHKRNISNWENNENIVFTNADNVQGAVISYAEFDNSIRVFWANVSNNHIYYRQRLNNGVWQEIVDLETSICAFSNARSIHVNSESNTNEYIWITFQVNTVVPYHLETIKIQLNCTNRCDVSKDGKVDLEDYFIVCKAYSSVLGSSNWNPDADINCDGKVDLIDIYAVSKNYGTYLLK